MEVEVLVLYINLWFGGMMVCRQRSDTDYRLQIMGIGTGMGMGMGMGYRRACVHELIRQISYLIIH